jgi:tetratricopeptide (TPR) repeat protein
MRFLILIGWLMVPVAVAAYHFGPGQERLRTDEVAELLERAEQHVAKERWTDAVEAYEQALRILPSDRVPEARRIRLERAKAQMFARQLPEANKELQGLVEELNADSGAEARLLADARAALANSQYYLTWLMRLEGLARDVWEPEIEAARQTFRLLAEEASSTGNEKAATQHREDLEAAIRLARMDLAELQGLPLPSQ